MIIKEQTGATLLMMSQKEEQAQNIYMELWNIQYVGPFPSWLDTEASLGGDDDFEWSSTQNKIFNKVFVV
jgi:hypothetical protein